MFLFGAAVYTIVRAAPVSIDELELFFGAGFTAGQIVEEVKSRKLAQPLDEAGLKRWFARGATAALVLQLRAPELVATPAELARFPVKTPPVATSVPAAAGARPQPTSTYTGISDAAHKDPSGYALAGIRDAKFRELDAFERDLRESKCRYQSGSWKLPEFYRGLTPTATNQAAWAEALKRHDEWLAASPNSSAARLGKGTALVAYAWSARGSCYSASVTTEGWKLFRDRLAVARAYLDACKMSTANESPQWYAIMMKIARGESWPRPQFEALYSEATSRWPDYHPLYYSKAAFLLPRWFGKPGEWEDYASQAARATSSIEGAGLYARICQEQFGAEGAPFFRRTKASWPLMKQGYRDLESRYPASPSNLNYFCYFACEAGDRVTAHELFSRIDLQRYSDPWNSEGAFVAWKSWANGGAVPGPQFLRELPYRAREYVEENRKPKPVDL